MQWGRREESDVEGWASKPAFRNESSEFEPARRLGSTIRGQNGRMNLESFDDDACGVVPVFVGRSQAQSRTFMTPRPAALSPSLVLSRRSRDRRLIKTNTRLLLLHLESMGNCGTKFCGQTPFRHVDYPAPCPCSSPGLQTATQSCIRSISIVRKKRRLGIGRSSPIAPQEARSLVGINFQSRLRLLQFPSPPLSSSLGSHSKSCA